MRDALAPLRSDFSVALHTFGNAFSVGAIIRVAHSFLAREVILIGSDPHYAKASMGMEKYERIVRVPDAPAFREFVGTRPVWAVEKDQARRSLHAPGPYPRDVVFLFGSERSGLPAEALEAADEVLGIPMYGVNHSFPVTVAAGIVMADWARRRFSPGHLF
ncbi:MAG: TrmH family RNA methyltransferase [Polyangiaceae bacterium]